MIIYYDKTLRKRWGSRWSGDYISPPYTVNNNLNSAESKQLIIYKQKRRSIWRINNQSQNPSLPIDRKKANTLSNFEKSGTLNNEQKMEEGGHLQQLKIKLAGQAETTPYTLNANGR